MLAAPQPVNPWDHVSPVVCRTMGHDVSHPLWPAASPARPPARSDPKHRSPHLGSPHAVAHCVDRSIPVVTGIALVALCLRSLSAPGYVLTTDAVFGPRPGAVSWGFSAPVAAVQVLLTRTAGGDVAGRVLAAVALLLCALGPVVALWHTPWFARVAAATLGVLNPWVYDRMADGQWGVVAAGGGLFVWVTAWDRLQRRPGAGAAVSVALTSTLVAAFSPPFVGMLGALAVLALAGQRPWRDARRRRWTLVALSVSGALLLYGAIPFVLGRGYGTLAAVTQYGIADFRAFSATASPDAGLWPTLLGLSGYWAERLQRFPLATADAPWWPVSTAVLTALALLGALACPARRWLLAAGLLGLLVAGSTATGPGLAAVVWLDGHFPLTGAYRDPTKWSALWLLALCLLLGEAIAALDTPGGLRPSRGSQRSPTSPPSRRLAGPLAATLAVAATLAPAGVGELRQLPTQLSPVRYPADWYATSAWLADHVSPAEPVLVLPWHLYQSLPFVGRVVANPAALFFPGTIIVSDDPELPGAPPPDPIAAASRHPEVDCRLAGAVRARARWVLVLPAPGAAADLAALQRCGFALVEGDGVTTSVLAG